MMCEANVLPPAPASDLCLTPQHPFLGFVTYPDHRRLKRRKGIYYRRRLRRLAVAYRAGEVPLDDVQASVRGWINHVRFANTVGLRKAVFRSVSFRSPPLAPNRKGNDP